MKVNYYTITLLCLLFSACLPAQSLVPLQEKMENLLKQQKLAGAVWTTVQQDSITTHSAGIKNLKTRELLQQTDKVHVGSITKTVLALGILRLTTQGKIKLNQPVKSLLPGLPLQNPWETTDPVTVRHLLDHTSGLSDLRVWHFFSSTATPLTPLSAFYTPNPNVLKVKARPGSFFAYSNMGYTILGMIIEQVTGQSYETYLDEQLLKPIGLHNSTFQFLSQKGQYKTADLAMGHFDDGSLAPALPIYLRPAGQFTTTARDMGILLQFLLNKGELADGSFIDSTYFDHYGKPVYTIACKNGLPNGYALGAMRRDRHGVVGITHSGNIIGYKAMLYLFPGEKKGFFIAHNMDSETADYEAFNETLIDYLDITRQNAFSYRLCSTDTLKKWEGFYIPAITKIEPFRLMDLVSGVVKVRMTSNGMVMAPFQKSELQLSHTGNRLFQAGGKIDPSVLLYENEQQLYLTTGTSTLQKVSRWKVFLITVSCLLGLGGLFLVLFSGLYQVIKFKSKFFLRPVAWCFTGYIVLIMSCIVIASNNIIYIGNKNVGSVLLYWSTILFPLLTLLSFLAYIKKGKNSIKSTGYWAVVCVLQFLFVLYFYGLVPYATWK